MAHPMATSKTYQKHDVCQLSHVKTMLYLLVGHQTLD